MTMCSKFYGAKCQHVLMRKNISPFWLTQIRTTKIWEICNIFLHIQLLQVYVVLVVMNGISALPWKESG